MTKRNWVRGTWNDVVPGKLSNFQQNRRINCTKSSVRSNMMNKSEWIIQYFGFKLLEVSDLNLGCFGRI